MKLTEEIYLYMDEADIKQAVAHWLFYMHNKKYTVSDFSSFENYGEYKGLKVKLVKPCKEGV